MLNYVRIACSVPAMQVANPLFNTTQMIERANEAQSQNADILVFPELSVTGYTCADLFLQDTLIDGAKKSIQCIVDASNSWDLSCIVGAPILIDQQLYNCALFIQKGKVYGIVPKTFLPNYNEFYEKRWFSSATQIQTSVVSSLELGLEDDYDIAIGTDLIFHTLNGVKVACEICEDAWTPISPGTLAAMNGAQIVVNLSGSNELIGKRSYRHSLISQLSAKNICAYAYCSTGENESTTDLIFSGHSMIYENGVLIEENKKIIDGDYIIFADVDLDKVNCDRRRNKSFHDAASIYGGIIKPRIIQTTNQRLYPSVQGEYAHVQRLPFVPSTTVGRKERCLNIFQMQVSALKKRIQVTSGKLVIGISGGLDSTLALLVCVEALRQLDLPLTNLHGLTMPCFGTSNRTYTNACELMKQLEIVSKEVNIKDACISHFNDIGHDGNTPDLTYENTQARERTQVLMDYAGLVGGFVVGTGDLSELVLGWCTYNADHMSMYGVNASIPKTLIRWMIQSVIDENIFENCNEVLKDIVDTPISPELLPLDLNGEIAQETESIVGPYELHDFFLYYVLRYHFRPSKIYALACRAFLNVYGQETILKWLQVFYRRFFSQQFKRSCLPDGVKVGSVCISPRGDLRMPSDASAQLWLKECENISLTD